MTERTLVLLRHGQSEWNLKNLFTGWKDPGLTERGYDEARAAGASLKRLGFRFDRAFVSDLSRAQETLRTSAFPSTHVKDKWAKNLYIAGKSLRPSLHSVLGAPASLCRHVGCAMELLSPCVLYSCVLMRKPA